jgi:hypothetical protein
MRIDLPGKFPERYEFILVALLSLIDIVVVAVLPVIIRVSIMCVGFDAAMRILKMKSVDGKTYASKDGCRSVTMLSQTMFRRITRIQIFIENKLSYAPTR